MLQWEGIFEPGSIRKPTKLEVNAGNTLYLLFDWGASKADFSTLNGDSTYVDIKNYAFEETSRKSAEAE